MIRETKFSGKEDCCKEFCEATKKHDRTVDTN